MTTKPECVSDLETHLGYWLRYVSNQVSHAFALKVQTLGVTVAEWVVMRDLYYAKSGPSALADRLGMTRGAISKLADRLEVKALIARGTVEVDGRMQILALTPAGRALVPKLTSLADENDEEFFGDLDPSVREMIAAAMKAIVRRKGLKAVPID